MKARRAVIDPKVLAEAKLEFIAERGLLEENPALDEYPFIWEELRKLRVMRLDKPTPTFHLHWRQVFKQISSVARNIACNALRGMRGDVVPARKPHTERPWQYSSAEWDNRVRVGGARDEDRYPPFFGPRDKPDDCYKPESQRRYIRTVHPRWLILLPRDYCEALHGHSTIHAHTELWLEIDIVENASQVIEDIWLLRNELRNPTPDLARIVFFAAEIGVRCERLSQGRLIQLAHARDKARARREAHQASVKSRYEDKRQQQSRWADEVHAARNRLSLMAACAKVARKYKKSVRRIHQIYREYYPRTAEE